MAKGGVNDEVLLAFVERSTNTFWLSTDDLLYLSDLGVAPAVITAMQRRSPLPETREVPSAPAVATASRPSSDPQPVDTTVAAPVPPTVPGPEAVAPANPPTAVTPTYVAPGPVPGVQPAQTVQTVQTVVTQPIVVQPSPVTVTYFQEALSPHGVWVEVPGYGRCWQPNYTVLGSGWRPYVDGGRWIWSDSGWYWLSDYSWGWATFHYGRWCSPSGFGWVWVPDTVWGPSWVCWRRTGSHAGWAPLPPGVAWHGGGWHHHGRSVGVDFDFGLGVASFVFLPWGRLCDSRPAHFAASHHHAHALHRDSRVANTTIIGNNNTIVFEGAGRSQAALASRSPIPNASLRETVWSARGAQGVREQMQEQKGGLVVNSPRLANVPASPPSAFRGSGRAMPTVESRGAFPSLGAVNTSAASSPALSGSTPSSRAVRGGFTPSVSGAGAAGSVQSAPQSTPRLPAQAVAAPSRAPAFQRPSSGASPDGGVGRSRVVPSLSSQPSLSAAPSAARPSAVAPAPVVSPSPVTPSFGAVAPSSASRPAPIYIRREAGTALSSSPAVRTFPASRESAISGGGSVYSRPNESAFGSSASVTPRAYSRPFSGSEVSPRPGFTPAVPASQPAPASSFNPPRRPASSPSLGFSPTPAPAPTVRSFTPSLAPSPSVTPSFRPAPVSAQPERASRMSPPPASQPNLQPSAQPSAPSPGRSGPPSHGRRQAHP